MRNATIYCFIGCLLLSFQGVSGAVAAEETPAVETQYSYRQFTTRDGLPKMLVESVYQDKNGYLWFGTLAGFARYDGLQFQAYLKGEVTNIIGFFSDSLQHICALSYYRKFRETTHSDTLQERPLTQRPLLANYYASRSLPPSYVVFETEDEQWRCVSQVVDTGLVQVFHHPLLTKMDYSHQVFWESSKALFYIPTSEGLYVCRDSVVVRHFPQMRAYSLVMRQNELLVLCDDGIYAFDNQRENLSLRMRFDFEAPDYGLTACVMKDGKLMVADSHSLYRYNGQQMEKIADGINLIRGLMTDAEGNLWVISYQGVYNFYQLQFKNYILTDRNDMMRSLAYNPGSHTLWAGTLNGKLLRFEDGTVRRVTYPGETQEAYFQPQGITLGNKSFLIGAGDLYEPERGAWTGLPFKPYLFVFPYYHNGKLLLGLGTRREIVLATAEGRVQETIGPLRGAYCAQQDPQGRLWIGTVRGLYQRVGDSLVLRSNPKDIITSMVKDGDGRLLYVQNNKLMAIRDTSIQLLKTYEHIITSVHVSQTGFLIVSTLQGVYVTNLRTDETMVFNGDNGFMGIEPLSARMAEDDKGTVWLASIDRLTSFAPDQLIYQPKPPQFNWQQVAVSKDNIHWESELVPETVAFRTPVRLSHNYRSIRFRFLGLSMGAPRQVVYQYRMVGFQDHWTHPEKEREAVFTNLRPGTYHFQVKASLGVEGTTTEVQTFTFTLVPALWQRAWFMGLCFVLGLGGTGFVLYRRMARRNAVKMQRLEREIKLNELLIKTIRLKSIPHFNANVLAGIEYYLMNYSPEEANKYLGLYARFTNQTLMDVDKAARPLVDEIKYVSDYLELEKMRYGEDVTYTITVNKEVDSRILVPNMVLHTYCENAIKHGLRNKKGPGAISVEVEALEGGVKISVSDNGIGREAAAKNNQPSTKQGLRILMQQIALYNQRNTSQIIQTVTDLYQEDGTPCGTRFELYVPTNFNFY